MRKNQGRFSASAMVLAVRAAMLATAAVPMIGWAQDLSSSDVKDLVLPTNTVEIGVGTVSRDSAKFGEYNGLDKSGAYFVGNLDLRGGSGYGLGGGTRRWQVFGHDLGTTSRSLGASIGDQGSWSLGIGYDELEHYSTDTYQTPFQGAMGGNSFTLPASFGIVNTSGDGTRAMTTAQLAMLQTQRVATYRKTGSISAAYQFNQAWKLEFGFSHLEQSGAKLIGSGSDAYNATAGGGLNWGGERIAILMNPTNYKTDTVDLAASWTGASAYASLAYSGSAFTDNNSGFSWNTPFVTAGTTGSSPGAAGYPTDTMSTPPSNTVHQLSLSGGYALGAKTHLSGGLSYSRNTQNASYDGTYTTTPNTVPGLPVNSLSGLVENTHADLRLTHQLSRALGLNAGIKYNERLNKTPSNVYTFLDLGAKSRTVTNIPMSNRRTQADLAAEYRFAGSQHLHVGYEYEKVQRWCENAAANNAQGVLPTGSSGYYSTASCVQVPVNTESRLNLGYRSNPTDNLSLNAGYTWGKRDSTVNSSFYNPMQAVNEGFENFGYLAFFDAARTEQTVKAGLNWQARQNLNVGLSARYRDDKYDATLGVQKGKETSLNFDVAIDVSAHSTITGYANWQDRTRDLLTASGRNPVAALPNVWSNHLDDQESTLGIGARQGGLLGGKLALSEDLTYSIGKTGYSTQVPYTLSSCTATSNLSCGSLPDFTNESTRLRLSGTFQLDRSSAVVLGYEYQRLNSSDYFYNLYQAGYTASTVLPTNQQSPAYTVNAIFVAYRYSFQ
ncbi:MAG: MtrB/PioB family decaheme-associated outer membrane protein [Burkholderiales bacterium]|nr:MtrB/PioB family decaheme-associated outer membrane protein [Burkholderiales bacterium]MDE2394858.1 MtrB/PioB family decaheme-associated outer membrane protein [Burkholderiales bacterium]